MRVLVTASRNWPSWETVWHRLDMEAAKLAPGGTLIVVHGDCPTGGDRQAREWCEETAGHYDNLGVTVAEERHPADWRKYGKRAGFLRNAGMVNLGADLCLAFIRDGSKGATMTADLAEKAGIPTVRFLA